MDEKKGRKVLEGCEVASDGTNTLALVAPETSKAASLCPGHF